GRETAPAAARPDRFFRNGKPLEFMDAVVGGRSVGVPGALRMLEMAHRRHGRLAWRELFQPAIELASGGFALSPRLHAVLQDEQFLRDDPRARALYYGKAVRSLIVNREYANTLKAVAANGANAFYEGQIASHMVRAVRSHSKPGDLSVADIKAYRAKEREPACGLYRIGRRCSTGP